jgi:hypothetical protein
MKKKSQRIPAATVALSDGGKDAVGETKIGKLTLPEGFMLARVNVQQTENRAALKLYRLNRPECHSGNIVRYVANWGIFTKDGKILHLIHRWLFLKAKTDDEAQAEFKKLDDSYLAEWAERKRLQATPSVADLHGAQWKVLARAYPGTVRLLEKVKAAASDRDRADLNKQAVAQWKAEGFALSGILLDGVADAETRKRMGAALRRKRKGFDAVDYELALNWLRKGYDKMRPDQLANAVCRATGRRLTPKTIRRRHERLRLMTSAELQTGLTPEEWLERRGQKRKH